MVDECRTLEVRAEGEGSGIDDHPLGRTLVIENEDRTLVIEEEDRTLTIEC